MRLQSNSPGAERPITLHYIKQRQHTHMGGGCHVNQWVRPFRGEGGDVGFLSPLVLGDTFSLTPHVLNVPTRTESELVKLGSV